MAVSNNSPVTAKPAPFVVNRDKFFKNVRETFFNGKLGQRQFEGMTCVIDEWEKKGYSDKRWLAYMFGTIYHETAKTMQPIEEFGRGSKLDYGKKLKMGQGKGKRVQYDSPDKLYYGRGFVQLTWYENYDSLGKLLGVELLQNPELALDMHVATRILFEGMTEGTSSKGDFTSKCLEMFFNDTTEDWVNARRIINGTDQADKIADHGKRFLAALS